MFRLGSILKRKENEVLNGIIGHLKIVGQTVDSLTPLIKAVSEGDETSAQTIVNDILNGETEADRIHRELTLKIAEGAFFGGIREDILTLIEKIDNIADSAKDAARLLSIDFNLNEVAVRILKSENMGNFSLSLRGAVERLNYLIEALKTNKREVLARIHGVEEKEEEADHYKALILKELFRLADEIAPVLVIQIRDFIFVADNIADNAEDASDVVLAMVAKGYG